MILTDELCDKLCAAAREKSREVGIDISFAVCDESGLPRVYRRYGEALVLSITLVPARSAATRTIPANMLAVIRLKRKFLIFMSVDGIYVL